MCQKAYKKIVSEASSLANPTAMADITNEGNMSTIINSATGRAQPDIVNILRRQLVQRPVEGETYSLFGNMASTDGYYQEVAALADRCLKRFNDHIALLSTVRESSGNRRRLRRASQHGKNNSQISFLLTESKAVLSRYTKNVTTHLEGLSLRARFDRTLSMSEEQYHLAMLEIELVNRIHAEEFARARTKLAFLPHCLRDWSRDCQSKPDGHDYICKACSKNCWVNGVSKMLRLHGITPYIWMSADLSRLFKKMGKHEGDLGVLGIACIPELMHGMRLCTRHDIPVVGIPLNANRCARWTGSFYDNSVDLARLASLLKPQHASS